MDIIYHEGSIREYDLKGANVSCLVEDGYISDEIFHDLIEGDKTVRNIIIGKLILKNPEVNDIITNSIKHYVELFIKSNKLEEQNILEIAKDALFTINVKSTSDKKLKTRFGNYVQFVPKNDYESCLNFSVKEGSSARIKLYLSTATSSVVVRGGKIDCSNDLYGFVMDMLRYMNNGDKSKYNMTLRKMILFMKDGNTEKLISSCENDRVLEVFRELATM